MSSLFYGTVTDLLKDSVMTLMNCATLKQFRLVGGTALSLQIGHRISVDIDLFTDAPYGSIDFEEIDDFIENTFLFHNHYSGLNPAMGKSYTIGTDKDNVVKLDIFYTDSFIQPALVVDGIRLATIEEIIAMKVDVVQRVGRKKDFWDLHELLTNHDIQATIALHQHRYPYTHDAALILKKLYRF
ncbi:nucleotidyl transferase AbiEii/AbiGii toxin family protein [Sphingobacterium wenxiniae]|uniref:Nucleotidyl transferase AbiEii toxin, Type IV TA system n=1 Tax=Sphingobacterium wenxiniae TaxID=683125 RepID=A0A1I6NZP2_9SPHI|nr:nucleotidyl transferase AbiEii/AbiGii toxin family protein [Sphingobacterium wenxiniae]SFS33423.1 Nucleotidyl transferase AbiEii toxin, Type IV TA system [Sphingobacterium wenxiniae]